MLYRLWYRRGGTANWSWHPIDMNLDTDPVAVTRSGTDCRRAGYPTITLPDGEAPMEFEPEGMLV